MKNKYAFGYLLILRALTDVISNILIVMRVTGTNGLHAGLLSRLNRSFLSLASFLSFVTTSILTNKQQENISLIFTLITWCIFQCLCAFFNRLPSITPIFI